MHSGRTRLLFRWAPAGNQAVGTVCGVMMTGGGLLIAGLAIAGLMNEK